MYGNACQVGSLKHGWFNRIIERHPILCLRTGQIVKCVRADASKEGLKTFVWELCKHCIEHKITSDRIFNMYKTGFFKTVGQKSCDCAWFKEFLEQVGRFLVPFACMKSIHRMLIIFHILFLPNFSQQYLAAEVILMYATYTIH
jgi:hypothetical protein